MYMHKELVYALPPPCMHFSREKTPEPNPLFSESTSTKSKDLFSDEYVMYMYMYMYMLVCKFVHSCTYYTCMYLHV